jgi:hypothetical protein
LKLSGIGSVEGSRVASYVNAGVGLGGLAREVEYGGALAVAAAPRVSITGELLGRWMASPGGIVQVAAPHPSLSGVQTLRLAPDASRFHSVVAVPGVKWNVADTWVLVCNVAVPLTTAGLTSPLTPFIGFDYSISR